MAADPTAMLMALQSPGAPATLSRPPRARSCSAECRLPSQTIVPMVVPQTKRRARRRRRSSRRCRATTRCVRPPPRPAPARVAPRRWFRLTHPLLQPGGLLRRPLGAARRQLQGPDLAAGGGHRDEERARRPGARRRPPPRPFSLRGVAARSRPRCCATHRASRSRWSGCSGGRRWTRPPRGRSSRRCAPPHPHHMCRG